MPTKIEWMSNAFSPHDSELRAVRNSIRSQRRAAGVAGGPDLAVMAGRRNASRGCLCRKRASATGNVMPRQTPGAGTCALCLDPGSRFSPTSTENRPHLRAFCNNSCRCIRDKQKTPVRAGDPRVHRVFFFLFFLFFGSTRTAIKKGPRDRIFRLSLLDSDLTRLGLFRTNLPIESCRRGANLRRVELRVNSQIRQGGNRRYCCLSRDYHCRCRVYFRSSSDPRLVQKIPTRTGKDHLRFRAIRGPPRFPKLESTSRQATLAPRLTFYHLRPIARPDNVADGRVEQPDPLATLTGLDSGRADGSAATSTGPVHAFVQHCAKNVLLFRHKSRPETNQN